MPSQKRSLKKEDLFFADKPAGCTTHTSLSESERANPGFDPNDGFKEMLEARLGLKLYTVHRLDRETTGAILFARTADAAEVLREAFASRTVHKKYLFLTDRKFSSREFIRESRIEREGSEFVSHQDGAPNSKTQFRLIEESHALSLWEARPETGKSHQIRLHAEDAGIPILGDRDHGGSPFSALCLHSAELVAGDIRHESSPPRWFTDRSLVHDRNLSLWLKSIDRRERLVRSWKETPETLRWIHSEGDPLRAEQLGDVYSLSWFDDELPNTHELASLQRLTEELGWKKWYLQLRGNRGRSPNEEKTLSAEADIPPRWTAEESGLRFEFRTDTGLSPGLFLDQRQNRKWVRAHSRGARVLNLFCYTAGFSVAAASGGAEKVVSVDVSKPFLDWSRTNFVLNALSTDQHEFRFIDSREYLAWAKKKELKFDLIICDPPSFGRSKSGVFKIEKDFDQLIAMLTDVTAPGGTILFSLNFEVWTEQDLYTRIEKSLAKKPFSIRRAPSPDWDFELPREPRNMKSFLISSKKM